MRNQLSSEVYILLCNQWRISTGNGL